MKSLSFLFLVFVLCYLLILPSAFASTKPDGTITVLPSIIRLDLSQDLPQANLTYTNNTAQVVELNFSASDFTQLEDSYKLSFLEGKNAKNYQYALSSWIDFDKKSISLQPGEQGTVTVLVNKEQLTPGGHYGTILASVDSKDTDQSVQIHSILSSLIFVRTATGKETDAGKIETFAPEREWFGFPNTFLVGFNNTGDTDLSPHGLIQLFDPFGKEVTRAVVNEDSLVTLPESIRRYDVSLEKQNSFLFPGVYKATIYLHFGKKDTQIQTQTRFFSLGSIPLLFLILLLPTLGFVGWKRYRR